MAGAKRLQGREISPVPDRRDARRLTWIKDRCGNVVQESRARHCTRVPAGGRQREFGETTETHVTKPSLRGRIGRGPFATRMIGAIAAVMLGLAAMAAAASAAGPAAGDAQCLACHGTPGFAMPLTDGGTLPLHIAGDTFGHSVHSAIGCTGCHSDISLATHPAAVKPIANRRAFSVAMAQICRTCHADQFQQWTTSVHATLVRQGDPNAPLCTSCHSPHAVIKGAAEAMDTVPCKACHGAIFTAYAGSVHGEARSHGLTQAPLCFGCHGAHAVHVPSEVQGLKDVCLGCHTEAIAAHGTWLPNVELHFDVGVVPRLPCAACPAPG